MATTTARRSDTVFSFTCAVGVLMLAACSGGDDTPSATLAPPITAPAAPAPPTPTTAGDTDEADDRVGTEGSVSEEPSEPVDGSATAATSAPSIVAADPTTAPSTAAADDGANDPGDDPGDDDTAPPPDATETTATATTAVDTAVDTTIDPAADAVDWAGIVTDLLDGHFRIAREPSLDLVRAVCLEPSGCFDDAARTVEVLQRDGVRVSGGAPFEIVSVEFQGTVDGAPVDATLAVNVIVRFIATDQGVVQLVDGDGNVVSDVAPDDRFPPGQAATRAVIVGRDSATAGWKLVALSDWM